VETQEIDNDHLG